MAIQFPLPTAGLTRSATYLNRAAAWTRFAWIRNGTTTPPTTFRNYHTDGDDTYAHPYVYLGSGVGLKTVVVEVGTGATTLDTVDHLLVDGVWSWTGTVYDATAHTIAFYVDGALIDTLSVNLSLVTFIEKVQRVGSGSADADYSLAFVREWQAALTLADLLAEAASGIPVHPATLLTDTPLLGPNNAADRSGNGRHWTVSGTPSLLTGPTVAWPQPLYLHVPPDLPAESAALLDATTGTVLQTFPFPATERGDILPSGIYAVAAEIPPGGGAIIDRLALFSGTNTPVATVTSIADPHWNNTDPVRANGATAFFVAVNTNARTQLYRVTEAGVVGGTVWSLPTNADSLNGMAPAADETILYYTDTSRPAPIYRYDLVNQVALGNLVAADGPNGNSFGIDCFLTRAGDLLVMARPVHASPNWVVQRYDRLTGTLLASYAIGAAATGSDPFLALDPDPAYFWVRAFYTANVSDSTFLRFAIATGVIERQFTVANVEGGGQVPKSCPFLVLAQAVPPPPAPGPPACPQGLPLSPAGGSACVDPF
jgi:hypothetical protein